MRMPGRSRFFFRDWRGALIGYGFYLFRSENHQDAAVDEMPFPYRFQYSPFAHKQM